MARLKKTIIKAPIIGNITPAVARVFIIDKDPSSPDIARAVPSASVRSISKRKSYGVDDTVLVDDPVALVDDPNALAGGLSNLLEAPDIFTEIPRPKIMTQIDKRPIMQR